jgi:two-component system, OmpR family, sensor histidine kinase KdpD
MQNGVPRPSPESLLAKLKAEEQARLRVYLGAAPGVGKTYQMLEDVHQLKRQGADVVVAVIETHGRADTAACNRYHSGRLNIVV